MIRGNLYVGWIPNVAGRLSFSHVGATAQPTRCERENTGNGYGRRVALWQRRPLGDWLLPDSYFEFLYEYSADWVFIFAAVTAADAHDQIARLQGEVLIIEHKVWDALREEENDSSTYRPCEIFDELRVWARTERDNPTPDRLPEDALQRLRAISLFSWNVGIRRSGIAWMRLKSAACDLAFSDDYTGTDRPANEADIRYIANQVFFFLKDISHAHRHHPPGSDTITESGPLDRHHTWVIDTHYRIHRKIVEMRRSKDPKVLFHASGMLAYINSLRKAVERELLPPRAQLRNAQARTSKRETRSALTYNNTEIENSIKSSVEVMKWRQTQKNIFKTALPALILAALAFTAGDSSSPIAALRIQLNNYISTHPRQAIGLIAMMGIISPFYYNIYDLYALPPILRAKRVLAASTIGHQAAFWLFGSITLFISSTFLLSLSNIMELPWATFVRAHPRLTSWLTVFASISLSVGTVYLLPFWTTRRDFGLALTRKLGRLHRRPD